MADSPTPTDPPVTSLKPRFLHTQGGDAVLTVGFVCFVAGGVLWLVHFARALRR